MSLSLPVMALAAMVPLPAWGAAFTLAVIGIVQFRGVRRERREAAARALTRHPSQQSRRRVPGLPVDGEPLSEAELAEFTGIMFSPVVDPENQNSASEEAE
jgi:hypothetical protein